MAVENRYPFKLPAGTAVFHRSAHPVRIRGQNSRAAIGWKHLAVFAVCFILLFLGVARLYYYLITCEALKIKNIEISASHPEIKELVENFLQSHPPGNILLCNLDYLRANLISLPGVKEARLEKVLPSTLRIEVTPRIPRIYVHRGLYFLVDEEGRVLRSEVDLTNSEFPVVEDEDYFNRAYEEKVRTACQLLSELEPEMRKTIRRIVFKSNQKMEIELVEDPVRLIIDGQNFREKLLYYLENRDSWARLLGPLEYVDLRIEGRVYVKPLELNAGNTGGEKKEVS
ncbi:MAG: FtsQ-type POTRA domain-containing protein [Candidatus Saccharicenans sp.]